MRAAASRRPPVSNRCSRPRRSSSLAVPAASARRRPSRRRGDGAIHLDGRVLALTVDPARRLANALGLQQFGNAETRVPKQAFADAGVTR